MFPINSPVPTRENILGTAELGAGGWEELIFLREAPRPPAQRGEVELDGVLGTWGEDDGPGPWKGGLGGLAIMEDKGHVQSSGGEEAALRGRSQKFRLGIPVTAVTTRRLAGPSRSSYCR